MTRSVSDEDLVEDALAGDEHAFSELFDRYRQPVFATVYRILQSPEEAQDATQEVFVKVYRSLRTWNPSKARFSTWLYRLAANQGIDLWRRRRRRAEHPLDETPIGDGAVNRLGQAIRSPYTEVEAREKVDAIRQCVDALPELQKKVFILRFFQDLKLAEIAELEECSLGTVKTSLFRATRAVRRSARRSGAFR